MRVVVGEDQALLREGLARLFKDAGHDVVGLASDGTTVREVVGEHRPDLAVVDIRMPPTFTDEGIQAAQWIRKNHPDVGVLVLSQHIHAAGVVDLVSQRGFGYLLKDRVLDVGDFLDAAMRVAEGGSALDPAIVATLVDQDAEGVGRLTSREREVLGLMAEGQTNAGIAKHLWLTEKTVEKHIGSILGKLGLSYSAVGHRRVLAVLAYLRASSAA